MIVSENAVSLLFSTHTHSMQMQMQMQTPNGFRIVPIEYKFVIWKDNTKQHQT